MTLNIEEIFKSLSLTFRVLEVRMIAFIREGMVVEVELIVSKWLCLTTVLLRSWGVLRDFS